MKKAPIPVVNHLTPDALKLILAQPDLLKASGRRDLTMLSVLYDTGARVQELADLTVRDVRLDPPPIVTLTGKGRKTSQVPLMSNTESLLRQYMAETRLLQNGMQDCPLFFNSQRGKLTPKGISFILDKYVSRARSMSSIIPDKVTPHCFRHTKAMNLLQAGVNLIYIRDLLGHVDLSTTEIYARTDTELKRKALEKGRRLADVIGKLTIFMRGWTSYFRLSQVKGVFEELDGWIRRKLRCILWEQWKKPETRAKMLMKHGIDKARACTSAYNGRGSWWNAGASHMNAAISTHWLSIQGLVSLITEQRRLVLLEPPYAERHVRWCERLGP